MECARTPAEYGPEKGDIIVFAYCQLVPSEARNDVKSRTMVPPSQFEDLDDGREHIGDDGL